MHWHYSLLSLCHVVVQFQCLKLWADVGGEWLVGQGSKKVMLPNFCQKLFITITIELRCIMGTSFTKLR